LGNVILSQGGSVSNAASGLIYAYAGILINQATGTVTNAGRITSSGGAVAAIGLSAGGSVTNFGSGSIYGTGYGVAIQTHAGSVINYGTILGATTVGVTLGGGGYVSNAASGTIGSTIGIGIYIRNGIIVNDGYVYGRKYGVDLANNATVTNAGTIEGGIDAIYFQRSGRLIVDPGATFLGTVSGTQLGGNAMELAAGTISGTLSGLGTSFTNFYSVVVDAGANWVLNGGITSGATAITIGAGSDVVLNGSVNGSQAVTFATSSGTLGIGDSADFSATLYGLQSGDTIDFSSLSTSGSITAGVDLTTHQLTLTQGASTLASIAVDPMQNFSGLYFDAVANGSSIEVTATATPCFCAGTRIRTVHGDVAVEDLKEGDLVVTASGRHRPIRWIGRRSYKGYFIRDNRDVLPIRIKAGALADNVPSRDLCVSPLHAMLVGGFLIPAFKLVNGVTIVQVQDVEAVHYFHIELDSHDILLAEDAPTESFVDDDSRDLFHNAPEYWSKHPRQPWRPARFCAPRIEDGYELEDALHPLLIRAGLRDAWSSPYGDPLGELRGWVEDCSPERIAGWAQNMEFPHAGVVLSIFLGDDKLADIIANKQRADLEEAGIGDGRHAFEYRPKTPIPAERLHTVRVVRAMDREALPGQANVFVAA
jgi:hypothetical protein